MGMDTYVIGVRDLDGEFHKMLSVKLACESASVSYPVEVENYFGIDVGESEEYIRSEMDSIDISKAVQEYGKDGEHGYEVDLSELPNEIKKIRFKITY